RDARTQPPRRRPREPTPPGAARGRPMSPSGRGRPSRTMAASGVRGGAMPIYLLRHGDAAPGPDDARRPLTEAGRAAVEGVAAGAGPRAAGSWPGGLRGAEQSALTRAGRRGAEGRGARRAGREPLDRVRPTAGWLLREAAAGGSLVLVGHLPFLARLTGRLVG